MSRSRRKTPKLSYTTSTSEKEDKQRYNRRERHATKTKLAVAPDEPLEPTDHPRSGDWVFAKDGKHWLDAPSEKQMRK